jgi:hypothetical protein
VQTMTLGKTLTLDNLRKRNVIVVDWCCMCKRSRESIDNLLLHCEVSGSRIMDFDFMPFRSRMGHA